LRVLFLFLDGVGLGKRDPSVNPLFAGPLVGFNRLCGGEIPSLRKAHLRHAQGGVVPLDATLGVPGLPQSGTGQTALFTGLNAAKLIGKHFGPYPYSTLRPLLQKQNLFQRLLDAGRSCCFANAFPQRFFDYIDRHPTRLTVTTLSCLYSGVPLLRAEDLAGGRAVSADVTGAGWKALGHHEIEAIDPVEAGRRLARLTRRHDFVLFEYWKPDHAGHAMSMREAHDVFEKLDAMLVGILEGIDRRDTLVLLTSDHGNVEDLRVRTHTRNPVPCVAYGKGSEELLLDLSSSSARTLCRVTPAIIRLLAPHAHAGS
jgi:2,3-bisphosphoglycerate-independent phosphoglycerate mutase